jgi:hypothetical protein
VNRITREVVRARCKSWRDCEVCAWVYGRQVERLLNQVKGLRAFVVFTMPSELGDWSNKEHIAAQARAKRRLAERLFRKFGRRPSMVWTREHNTHQSGPGRLHLNLAWDIHWLDQNELSKMAEACGFGRVVDIRRIRGDARGVTSYAAKCLRYASKDLRTQADWPKGTRRWGASREARAQMMRPAHNPDWFWSEDPEARGPARSPDTAFVSHDRYGNLVVRFIPPRPSNCVCHIDRMCCCGATAAARAGLAPPTAAARAGLAPPTAAARAGPAPPTAAARAGPAPPNHEPTQLTLF